MKWMKINTLALSYLFMSMVMLSCAVFAETADVKPSLKVLKPLNALETKPIKTNPLEAVEAKRLEEDVVEEKIDNAWPEGLLLTESLVMDKTLRESLVYLPCHYSTKQERPLVIVLHGARLTGKLAEVTTGFDKQACSHDFIVAYPQALNKQWNDGRDSEYTPSYEIDDVHFILHLTKVLEEKYNIDPKRVYVVGYSSGGMMAQKIAMEAPNKVAGIAVVAASLPEPQYKRGIKLNVSMPVVIIHGTKDHAFPVEGGDTGILGVKVGPVLPILDMLNFWLTANGGARRILPFDEELEIEGDNIEVFNFETFKKTQVTLFKVNGGGHTWPGANIPFTYIPFLGKQVKNLNAAEVIWQTLHQYTR